MRAVQQPSIRNPSIVAAFVYSQGGEFTGGVHRFAQGTKGACAAPPGLYARLRELCRGRWQPEPGTTPAPTGDGGDTVGWHSP